jgi:hypothetical protein
VIGAHGFSLRAHVIDSTTEARLEDLALEREVPPCL